MFARMTFLQVKLDCIDEAIELYEKSVIPSAKRQRGFRGYCLLSNREDGKGISVTFWKTREDALANEKSLYYQEQLVKGLGFLTGPPIREEYEVNIHQFEALAKRRAAKKAGGKKRPKAGVKKK